jgi:hypothetical protein
MDAQVSCETLVHVDQITQHHMPKDLILILILTLVPKLDFDS